MAIVHQLLEKLKITLSIYSLLICVKVNRTLTHLGLAYTDIDTDCIIAMATVLHGNQTLRSVDLSRPLLHSRLEESTIHISRMLQVNDMSVLLLYYRSGGQCYICIAIRLTLCYTVL